MELYQMSKKLHDPYRFPLRGQATSWWPAPSSVDLLALANIFDLAVAGAISKGFYKTAAMIEDGAETLHQMSITLASMERKS
jgi:hypothetical protein